MQPVRQNLISLLGVTLALVSSAVESKAPPPAPAPATTSANALAAGPAALSSSLGVIVFPAKNQTHA